MANVDMAVLETAMANFQNTHPTQKIHSGDIWMAPQFAKGKSIWAHWVETKKLEGWNIVWAWRELPNRQTGEGIYRQWLAIRLDSGRGKAVFIDLTDPGSTGRPSRASGRAQLKLLEQETCRFLIARDKHNKAKK